MATPSDQVITLDPAKVTAITNWPTPYRRRKSSSSLVWETATAVSCTILERDWEFLWTEVCEVAFRRLQEKLVFAPILVFPDFTKTFLLDTNVSNEGIGAVLSQVERWPRDCHCLCQPGAQQGRERLLCYHKEVGSCRDLPTAVQSIPLGPALCGSDRPQISRLADKL